MSHVVSGLVQRRRVGSPTAKAVLMYMAGCASDDGSGIWTSKANMAADLEISRRSVQRAVDDLIAAGLVAESGRRPCSRGYTVEYRIVVEAVERLPSTRDRMDRPICQTGDTESHVTESHTNIANSTGDTESHVTPCHVTGDTVSRLDVSQCHTNHPENHPLIKEEEEEARARDQLPVDRSNVAPHPAAATASADELYDRVLAAAGLTSGRLPTWWLPPAATLHVARWRQLGLTDDEIVEVVRQAQARFAAPPSGPKAYDRAVAAFAAEKTEEMPRPQQAAQQTTRTGGKSQKDYFDGYIERLKKRLGVDDEDFEKYMRLQ